MASSDEVDQSWDAEKMLDLYLHDYLVKKKLHNTAALFRREANVAQIPVAIDSFDGFLQEWWSVFYDIFASRILKQQEAQENSFVQAGQMPPNMPQNDCPIMPPFVRNQRTPVNFLLGPDNNNNNLSRSPAFVLPGRMHDHEQHPRHPIRSLYPSYLQQQIRNQGQLLVTQNRNGNSITGANPSDINLQGAPRSDFPITRPSGEGVSKVPSNYWLSKLLTQTANGAHQVPLLTDQGQHNQLGQPLSLPPASYSGRRPILPKPSPSGKDVQLKQTERRQVRQNRHMERQLPAKGRKRRRSSCSKAGGKILGHGTTEVDKPVDEIESFLCTDDDKNDSEGTSLGPLKHPSTACGKTDGKGFTFQEIGCLHSSKSKVLCCQFSSDGRLLASAGHDKKVFIWNMETFEFNDSSEGHSSLITDVRFKPNSTILATSSFDRTLHIWNAAKPCKSLSKLFGHGEQVLSLDFHPTKLDLLCSCDSNDEIRLWDVNRGGCIKASKGASKQVRFQPQCGKLLATASGNSINVIDIENDSHIFNLTGHAKEVLSLSWDISGKYIASVSADSARIWSLASGGNCIHELHSNGNKFQSCAFHPGYSQLLMIGGYQSLELWNPINGNKTQSISAHNGLISALAGSLETKMIASASHDRCVKLWK